MNQKFLLVCALFSTFSFAQGETKLSGKIIGTEYSVDYTSGAVSTTVNTKDNAFDGRFDTFFASYERSNTWVGLDLGEKYIISKVGYAARDVAAKRVQLGLFEGANSPDFSDALPLYIIPEPAEGGRITQATVDCSKGFRYIRYVGPNDSRCNIAELEFFGEKGEGDDSSLFQLTNLPVLIINTNRAEDIISKEENLRSNVKIIYNNGTKLIADSADVRGRGNSSWRFFDKKPYRIKFDSKQLVPGASSKSKKWTLLSNYDDKTLMRNDVGFEISRRIGFPFTSICTQVDLILNGEYKGTYGLCDQVEVGTGRVKIEEMAPTDVALPALSGGYLVEIDGFGFEEASMFYSQMLKIPVTIKSPDEDDIVKAQSGYIQNFFNLFERAALTNYPQGEYRKYIDMELFVKYMLLEELTGNMDAYWSTYMYKKRGDDKLYTGPVWDFDIAFDNDNRVYPVNKYNDYLFRTGGASAGGMKDLVNKIFIEDRETKNEIYQLWKSARETQNITPESLCAFVDEKAAQLDQSQKLNFKRWDILNKLIYNNPQAAGSYKGEIDFLKSYIVKRFAFLDKIIGYEYTSVGGSSYNNTLNGSVTTENRDILLTDFPVNSIFSIYNICGTEIMDGICRDNETRCRMSNSGVYIVKITSSTSIQPFCAKIIIK